MGTDEDFASVTKAAPAIDVGAPPLPASFEVGPPLNSFERAVALVVDPCPPTPPQANERLKLIRS